MIIGIVRGHLDGNQFSLVIDDDVNIETEVTPSFEDWLIGRSEYALNPVLPISLESPQPVVGTNFKTPLSRWLFITPSEVDSVFQEH